MRQKRHTCSCCSYGKVFAIKTVETADLVNLLGRLLLLSQGATPSQALIPEPSCHFRAKLPSPSQVAAREPSCNLYYTAPPLCQAVTPKPCCDLLSHLHGSLSESNCNPQAKLSTTWSIFKPLSLRAKFCLTCFTFTPASPLFLSEPSFTLHTLDLHRSLPPSHAVPYILYNYTAFLPRQALIFKPSRVLHTLV